MSQRAILITGGNGAIGRATARAFLGGSDPAAVVYLGVRENKAEAEGLCSDFPGRCFTVPLEVTNPEDWKRSVDRIISECDSIHVLVNNAGMHRDSLLATMQFADWEGVIRTTLDGAFHGCQAVVPRMMAQREGRIINVASLSALLSPAGQTNYSAAKAGLVAMTQSLAKEVARARITVNAVCPGFIETEALRDMPQEERDIAAKRIPMRRFGRPEEVAAVIRFLACPEAGYITGSIIKIDGGIF